MRPVDRVALRFLWDHRGLASLIVVIAVVVGLAILAWNKVPNLYPELVSPTDRSGNAATDRATRSQAIVTTRASVLAALAGLGALVTIGINYRNSRTQLRNAETANETLATTQKTFRVTERGHLTDRYAKAIEQLGSTESIAIRLGGIYALQQLAVDTDRDSDQAAVVEVLSAFVRLNLHAGATSEAAGNMTVSSVNTTGSDEPAVPQRNLPTAGTGPRAVEPTADVLA